MKFKYYQKLNKNICIDSENVEGNKVIFKHIRGYEFLNLFDEQGNLNELRVYTLRSSNKKIQNFILNKITDLGYKFEEEITMSGLSGSLLFENKIKKITKEIEYDENVFVSKEAENLFYRIHEDYKESQYKQANYSFLFYAMREDNFLTNKCDGKYWCKIFLDDLGVTEVSRIDSRQC